MNRNNNSGSIVFFIFFMIFIFGGVVVPIFSGLLPIFIVLFIIYNVFKAASTPDFRSSSRVRNSSSRRSSNSKTLSNRDRNRIDKKLEKYFRQNIKLPIVDNIALTTKNGNYTVIEDLYISMDDELIMSMEEFRNDFSDMYDKICELLLAFSKEEDNVFNSVETKKEEAKVQEELSNAQKYIDKINSLNVDIANEEVKNGLYQTSALLKQIDLYADEDDDDKLTKLYDYYLPILTKILENYKNLGKINAKNDEFKKNETQLVKTIALINEALKEMNKSLHEDEYMNLSADITTLQSLLKKDGLISNPFQKEEQNGKE